MSNRVDYEKLILNGRIIEGSEWNELRIGDEVLSTEMQDYFQGILVKMTYYISNVPIPEDKAVEMFLTSFYEGRVEADGTFCHGSSWTGVYARNDKLEVGGHDIIEELSQYKGKYCHIEVEYKPKKR